MISLEICPIEKILSIETFILIYFINIKVSINNLAIMAITQRNSYSYIGNQAKLYTYRY